MHMLLRQAQRSRRGADKRDPLQEGCGLAPVTDAPEVPRDANVQGAHALIPHTPRVRVQHRVRVYQRQELDQGIARLRQLPGCQVHIHLPEEEEATHRVARRCFLTVMHQ